MLALFSFDTGTEIGHKITIPMGWEFNEVWQNAFRNVPIMFVHGPAF